MNTKAFRYGASAVLALVFSSAIVVLSSTIVSWYAERPTRYSESQVTLAYECGVLDSIKAFAGTPRIVNDDCAETRSVAARNDFVLEPDGHVK